MSTASCRSRARAQALPGRAPLAAITLRERPYAGVADLDQLIDLLLLCRTVAGLDPWPPIRAIRRHLRATTADIRADTRLWQEDAGAVLAFASLWDGEILVSCVHPRAYTDELMRRLLAWAQWRARQHARRHGERATLCVPLRDDQTRDGLLLERQGFTPEAWWTLRMARRLDTPIPAPTPPDGFSIRQLAGESELASVVALHQEVFATASAYDEQLAVMRDPEYRPSLDLVAAAPDGRLAGFCICSVSRAEDQRHSQREGWIELIGVERRYRRHGLGQALLLAGLRALASQGLDTALLGTTSWNTPAQCLYANAGFSTIYRVLWYVWEADGFGNTR